MNLSPLLLNTLKVAADGFGFTHARHQAPAAIVARRYAALFRQGLLLGFGSTHATLSETGRAALNTVSE